MNDPACDNTKERQASHPSLLELRDDIRRLAENVRWNEANVFRQLEAFTSLVMFLQPSRPLPPCRGWAMSPDSLLHIVDLLLDHGPETMVELGSGTSTLVLGYAFKRAKRGRLISFEHSADLAELTNRRVAGHGLSEIVRVCTAPLTDVGDTLSWYDPKVVLDVVPERFDALLVDGPPSLKPEIRQPALPLLAAKLAAGAMIFLDDARREGERRVLSSWTRQFGIKFAGVPTEKGLAVGIWTPGVRNPDHSHARIEPSPSAERNS